MSKVLVAEDDTLLASLLVEQLKKEGYETRAAFDGEYRGRHEYKDTRGGEINPLYKTIPFHIRFPAVLIIPHTPD